MDGYTHTREYTHTYMCKEVKAGETGIQGCHQLPSKFSVILDYRRLYLIKPKNCPVSPCSGRLEGWGAASESICHTMLMT